MGIVFVAQMSWGAVYVATDMGRMVDYSICRIRDVTFLIGGTHGRIA